MKKDRHSPFGLGGNHQGKTAADDPAGLAAPGLFDERLRAANITTVLIAGCVTNCCCEATARDAMQRNYRVVMLADACAAGTDADHNAALNSCAQIFGDVMEVDEVIEQWDEQRSSRARSGTDSSVGGGAETAGATSANDASKGGGARL
eukprot:SAG22_NODE_258_length_13522_cov_6.989496_6_plen_149_part_00